MKFEPKLYKLSNGVTVILDPMDVVTTKVIVGFGLSYNSEMSNEQGITHFCEHMFFDGTTRFKDDIARKNYIDSKSGTYNARTSVNFINLHGRILSENVNVLLDVFSDMLQNSLFREEDIEREKRVILDELRRKQSLREVRIMDYNQKVFFGGKYSPYQVLGPEENIKSFSRDQLKMYLARKLSSKNCVICISGKIENQDALLKDIENKFSFLKPFDVKRQDEEIPYNAGIAHYKLEDSNNTTVDILFPDLWKPEPENDFKRLCVSKFESWIEYNLYNILREERGLVYGVKQKYFGFKNQKLRGFSTTAVPQNIEEVVATMAKIMQDIYTKNHITEDFLKRDFAKCCLGDADFLESNQRRAEALFIEWLDTGDLYDFYKMVEMARTMTVQDVITNTRGYFAGPVSFGTVGVDYQADLMKVWQENTPDLRKADNH